MYEDEYDKEKIVYRDEDWTKREDKILIENYIKKRNSLDFVAIRLGRSKIDVLSRAKELKIYKSRPFKYWEPEELEFLKNNYSKMPVQEIAKQLNRTVISVKEKLRRIKEKTNKDILGGNNDENYYSSDNFHNYNGWQCPNRDINL